jgi:hypothetical protein
MTKSLKLPIERRDPMWSLTERDYMFLDLTILFNKRHADLYRMVSSGTMTDAILARKASAITTSNDGIEYLEARRKQLEGYFWPNDGVEGCENKEKKQQSNEEMLAELIPEVVKDLRGIARDKNDENYADLVKVVLAKLIKDMDTKNAASPPLRYLPEIPCQNCRYKLFCESECDDMCKICLFKKYGIEHGLNYDYKNQLDKTIENG